MIRSLEVRDVISYVSSKRHGNVSPKNHHVWWKTCITLHWGTVCYQKHLIGSVPFHSTLSLALQLKCGWTVWCYHCFALQNGSGGSSESTEEIIHEYSNYCLSFLSTWWNYHRWKNVLVALVCDWKWTHDIHLNSFHSFRQLKCIWGVKLFYFGDSSWQNFLRRFWYISQLILSYLVSKLCFRFFPMSSRCQDVLQRGYCDDM